MFPTYEKPTELLPLAIWVFEDESGRVWCTDCKCGDCHGCPAAHRRKDGRDEYYRPPIHGMGRA